MSTVQLRPDGEYLNQWDVIEQSSATAALSDNADNSSIRGTFAGNQARIAFSSFALPAGAVTRTITPIARVSTDAAPGAYFQYQLTINNTPTVGTSYTSPTITNVYGSSGPINLTLTGLTTALSQSDIDNLGFLASAGVITGTSHPFIHELYCNVVYVPAPTTVATGPTGTLTINNPTLTWVHQPGSDAPGGQDAYRIIIYDTAGPVAYDTGEVAGGAQSQVVGPLPLERSYIAYVYTRQTTNGYVQWSNAGDQPTPTSFTLSVTGPTVTVNGPTGVVGTTSPTVTWTHHPGTGAQTGQTYYRLREHNTATGALLVESGDIASSASSARIGPLDPAISWTVFVATAQTTYGVQQWTPWDATAFTIDVVPTLIATVTATPQNTAGAVQVTVTRNTTTPLWQTIDVQATYDSGATWVPVRGATRLTANGNTAYVTDYEAPNDQPVAYRARAYRTSSGQLITGPWVQSTPTQWTLPGNDVWIKDPDHPERNMTVCVAQLPEATYDRVVGVFRPVGAHYPVVVSDVLQAFTASVGVMTSTTAEAEAFLDVCKAPVVLAQSPSLPWGWGSRYVALGAVQETHLSPTSPKAHRLWTVAMTEVERPADETAT